MTDIDPAQSANRPAGMSRRPRAAFALAQRQVEIVDLIAAGHTNKELASMLGIAEGTVHTHLARMFRRLGVRSRAALVARYLSGPGLHTHLAAFALVGSVANGTFAGN